MRTCVRAHAHVCGLVHVRACSTKHQCAGRMKAVCVAAVNITRIRGALIPLLPSPPPLCPARRSDASCWLLRQWEIFLVSIPQILSCGDSENFGQAAEAESGCGGMEARRRVGKARAAPRAVTRSTSAGPGLYSRPARHTHGAPARAPSAPAPTVVPSARSPASARHGRGRCGKGRAPSPRAVAARLAPICLCD